METNTEDTIEENVSTAEETEDEPTEPLENLYQCPLLHPLHSEEPRTKRTRGQDVVVVQPPEQSRELGQTQVVPASRRFLEVPTCSHETTRAGRRQRAAIEEEHRGREQHAPATGNGYGQQVYQFQQQQQQQQQEQQQEEQRKL